jgi:hypothetical protein
MVKTETCIQRPKNNLGNGDNGSLHPKKFKRQKLSSKLLVSVFRNKAGIFPVHYLEKSATIMAKYYAALLNKLK